MSRQPRTSRLVPAGLRRPAHRLVPMRLHCQPPRRLDRRSSACPRLRPCPVPPRQGRRSGRSLPPTPAPRRLWCPRRRHRSPTPPHSRDCPPALLRRPLSPLGRAPPVPFRQYLHGLPRLRPLGPHRPHLALRLLVRLRPDRQRPLLHRVHACRHIQPPSLWSEAGQPPPGSVPARLPPASRIAAHASMHRSKLLCSCRSSLALHSSRRPGGLLARDHAWTSM